MVLGAAVTNGDHHALAVLLVDDHALFRHGLATLLTDLGFRVVGEASTGEAALEMLRDCRPDVVVMDLHMPGTGGLAALRRIADEPGAPAVVVLSASGDADGVLASIRAGTRGYVLKGAEPEEIAAALRAAASGATWLSPGVDVHVRRAVATNAMTTQPVHRIELNDRERDVLRMLASGMANGRIASELSVSPSTVKAEISAILDRLGVENRVQAAVFAAEHGLA